jgi:hypothetical protein
MHVLVFICKVAIISFAELPTIADDRLLTSSGFKDAFT